MDNQEIQAKLCTQDTGRKKNQLSAKNFKEEQNEHHQKSSVNPGAREGYAVKSIYVAEADTFFFLLILQILQILIFCHILISSRGTLTG